MLKISGWTLVLSLGLATFVTLQPNDVRAQNDVANGNADVASDRSGSNSDNGNRAVPEMSSVAAASAVIAVAGGLVLMSVRRRRASSAA
jgi:hypothetical protein